MEQYVWCGQWSMKLFSIDVAFLGINFWPFSRPAFIIIKTAIERCNSTTHILLRTWFKLNQVNNQIGTTVQNPFTNVKCFTFILVLKNVSFLNKMKNLGSRPTTRHTFIIWRWFILFLVLTKWFLSDLGFLQPIIGGSSPKTLRVSLLGVKRMCISLRTFWKFLIEEW